jgi:uncharacterized protein (TIGR03437 family)
MRQLRWGWLALVLVFRAGAQPQYYQYSIDQDALAGAPDFSFLNHPLTAADRIFARDSHFYLVGPDLTPNTADDEPVRFFGVSFTFGANFPEAKDAPRIAKRLRRLGFNLVRLHHMDSWIDSNPADANGVLTTGPYPSLNPVSVPRLRGFLDALKAEGIYIDLNLHVGYPFRPSVDNVPASDPWPDQGKPFQIFFPRMVDLQSQYTSQLLAALSLRNDPVLAMVEINNESSLAGTYEDAWSNLDGILKGAYQSALQSQWIDYLRAKYANTDALRLSWGATGPNGPQLLDSNWQLELHSPAQGTMQTSGGEVVVRMTNTSNWVIAKLTGFSVSVGQPYMAEVEMRADIAAGASGTVYWTIMQDTSPWQSEAGTSLTVTNAWQKYTLAVNPAFAMDGVGRFHLGLENAGSTVHIRNWSFHTASYHGLDAGQSLETGNIPLVPQGDIPTDARLNDYLLFLADRDRHYYDTILSAIRAGTDQLVPVTGTQMDFGGFLNIDSHVNLDFRDNHFYVDHPQFPHTAWDAQDWRINDSSATGNGLNEILETAVMRQAGYPYTVSEYNEPWPNTHGAEIDPVLAAFASFQDWDAIMHFDYQGSRDWDRGLPSWFDLDGDLTKLPNVGQSAMVFRSAMVRPGIEPMEVPLPLDQRLKTGRWSSFWDPAGFLSSQNGLNTASLFAHPMRLLPDAGTMPQAAQTEPAKPYHADTGESTYDPVRQLLLIHAPSAAGVIGFAGTQKATAGAIDLELAAGTRGFASVLVTALDQKPIGESASLLLTNPGYALRTMPGSNPPAPQTLVNYPGLTSTWTLQPEPGSTRPSGNESTGQGPMWIERVEGFVTLRTTARQVAVYPLDSMGTRLAPLTDVEAVDGGFRIHLQADGQSFAPWYEIAASGFAAAASLTNVSAAGFLPGPLAPESIVSGWGTALAAAPASATALPLPVELGGTSVSVRDASGVERAAPLFYVSPNQVNYQIPAGTIPGLAIVTLRYGGTVASAATQIDRVAPGLFAGAVDASNGSRYLILYGTGIRFRNSLEQVSVQVGGVDLPVLYAGPQGSVGLDQVNALLPEPLAASNAAPVTFRVEGKLSNQVAVDIP